MIVKKIVFCLAVVFLLASCGRHEWADTVVANNSGFEVTFKFYHTGEIMLDPGASTSFGTVAHQNMEWFRPNRRVDFTATDGGTVVVFNTLSYWKLVVENTLDNEVALSERGGWLEMGDIERVPAHGTVEVEIFTLTPDFAAFAFRPKEGDEEEWERATAHVERHFQNNIMTVRITHRDDTWFP